MIAELVELKDAEQAERDIRARNASHEERVAAMVRTRKAGIAAVWAYDPAWWAEMYGRSEGSPPEAAWRNR